MPKLTDQEIEDQITDEIYEILSKQMFYEFYMSEDVKSFTAHIQSDTDCPSKDEIKKELKELFSRVISKTKEFVHGN